MVSLVCRVHNLLFLTLCCLCGLLAIACRTAVRAVMNVVVAVVTAACDDKFSEAKVVDFHGKVCMCLEEVVFEVRVCLSAVVCLSDSPYGKRARACAQRPGLPQACGCG